MDASATNPNGASSTEPPAAELPAFTANARQTVEAMRGPFTTCYQSQLARRRDAEGKVELAIVVGCDGETSEVRAKGRGLDRAALACVVDVASRAHYPPPPGGVAVMEVPITFVRKEPTPATGPAP